MGRVYAGREITYGLAQGSRGHLGRAADAEEGTQLIDVKWNCLLYQQERRQGYQKYHLSSQTFTNVVDGSDEGDLEIEQRPYQSIMRIEICKN